MSLFFFSKFGRLEKLYYICGDKKKNSQIVNRQIDKKNDID